MSESDATAQVGDRVRSILAALARIADIARDPETPRWFTGNLRRNLQPAFDQALQLLLWSHARAGAWDPDDAVLPTQSGSAGLGILLDQLELPRLPPPQESDLGAEDDDDHRPTIPPGVPHEVAQPWTSERRQLALRQVLHLLGDRPPALDEAAARVLAWIGYSTAVGSYEDIALLTPGFLGKEVGLASDEAHAALDRLVGLGHVRVVEDLRLVHRDRIPVQIVVGGR